MKVIKTNAVVMVDDREYEIIKAFCKELIEIYRNNTDIVMDEILEEISDGHLYFDDFEFKIE